MNITTLIISSNNRVDNIRENVNSLMKFSSNIFVVVNGANEKVINFLTATKKNYSFIDFMVFENKINKSDARNAGVEHIKSDIIYFLDDDAFIEDNNIKILKEKFEQYQTVGVIGGPNLTPHLSSRFQQISGILLSTYLMSYKMSNRYLQKGTDRITDDSELILCNLAIKKDLFEKYNLKFNRLLHYNEENLLLEQIRNHNIKIMFSPQLKVYHHRRKDLQSFIQQVYNSGKGRGTMSIIIPSSIKLFFLIPSLFVMYLILLLFGQVSYILLNLYLLITLYNVIVTYFQYKLKLLDIVAMFIISFCSHISYGIGFIFGLFKGILWKHKKSF